MEDNLADLNMLNDIITMILSDNYIEGVTNIIFSNTCRHLKEDAQIYAALYPGKAHNYLKDRKSLVYITLKGMTQKQLNVDLLQMGRLEFVKRELMKLYTLYMDLFYEVRN